MDGPIAAMEYQKTPLHCCNGVVDASEQYISLGI